LVDDVVRSLERVGLGGPPPAEVSPRSNEIEVLDGLDLTGRLRSSAVLLALFEEAGQARVVLTRRSTRLNNHRGEVSFPGGRVDAGESTVDAALREAREEVALDPAMVRVLAHLHPIVTLASASLIQPVIGVLPSRPELVGSPAEVERVFDIALADLLAPGVFHEERWRRPERPSPRSSDGSFPLWFFEIEGEMIWGATGRLLVDVLCAVLGVEVQPEA
jgi:8-oxo-dGTP pyrophosphatase MutT (NUDIX family)